MLYFLLVQLASCTLNKVYISSTLILSVVISVVAILPWVQKGTTPLNFRFPGFHPLAATLWWKEQGYAHHTV